VHMLIVLAHPDAGSFNHAIAQAAAAALAALGHHVVAHDLYAEGFDPLITAAEIPKGAVLTPEVARHCAELAAADGIVIVHPNWWGQPPAILKGWIDRVIRPGVAYEFREGDGGEGVPVGLLRARAALVLNTANTPRQRELAAFGDPLEALWKRCIFDLCGVTRVERRTFEVVVTSTPAQRAAWLDAVGSDVARLFPRD
jgi:NAD(P)H dehydrogenase (quinone)